jgi:hypothetical protein
MIAKAIIKLIPLWLFSLLAKEYIPAAALTLALLSTFHITRIQQCRIEKLEDEYKGQRAINLAATEKHRAAYTTLQRNFHSFSNEKTACTRVHYEHPSVETVRDNSHLKERLHQLRLCGKTTTCTRTHHDRSTAEMTCANRVLIDSTRKLRVIINNLRSDVDHREKTVKSLQRSLETVRIAAKEEIRGKDASIEDLELNVKVAAARHNEGSKEIHQLRAAARDAKSHAREFEQELRILRALKIASCTPEDAGPQRNDSDVLLEDVDQAPVARPLSPKCATVEDDDEEEL